MDPPATSPDTRSLLLVLPDRSTVLVIFINNSDADGTDVARRLLAAL